MINEKEIEHLAQIFANKRHSSIEWGRECARIVIEAGYRPPSDKPEVQLTPTAVKSALNDKFGFIWSDEHIEFLCERFGQPPAVAIVWPEKEDTNVVCGCWIRNEPCSGWSAAIDACQQAVKAAGVREIRYPEKALGKQQFPGDWNDAIDEMRKLNEEKP